MFSTALVVSITGVLIGPRFSLEQPPGWQKFLLRLSMVGMLHLLVVLPLLTISDRLVEKTVGIGVNYDTEDALAEVAAEYLRLRLLELSGLIVVVVCALLLVKPVRSPQGSSSSLEEKPG